MAKQTITMLTDDLDGGAADRTIVFGYEGGLYEIDLSEANAKAFDEVMEKYTHGGTRKGRLSPVGTYITGTQGQARKPSGAEHPNFQANKDLNRRIREWAEANNYKLAARGRISQHIVDAYHRGVPNVGVEQDALPSLQAVEPVETKMQAARRVISGGTATATKTAPAKVTRTRRSA